MAIRTTEAIVLNRKDFRETSALAVFYSKDFGKIRGILKGIRSERSRYGSLAELFGLNKIVFYEKSRSEFQNITQCDLLDGFFGIRKNLAAMAHTAYLAELVDAMTESNEPGTQIYELLHRSFKLISAGEDPNKIARIFELKFLSYSGFALSFEKCVNCGSGLSAKAKFSQRRDGMLCEKCLKEDLYSRTVSRGTVQTLSHIMTSKPDSLLKFKISRSIEDELEALIDRSIESHLERPLKSKRFLKDVKRLKK
jgi:DNA repair protein RecO (recombination protein O)